jgi:hypothetical protein
MLNMAIGLLIHQERQRKIERTLEVRRLLEPAPEDTGWAIPRGSHKGDGERRPATRHETAGATS